MYITIIAYDIVIIALLLIIIIGAFLWFNGKRKFNSALWQKDAQIKLHEKELENRNATAAKFFSILAHDTKNQFHTIIGYSLLLKGEYEQLTDEERRKYVGEIYKTTVNVSRLLQNLLDWSRSKIGTLKYEPKVFSFRRLYVDVSRLLKPLADQKKITLEYRIPEKAFMYADPMMIEIILRNLVDNAIKFSYEGGGVTTEVREEEMGFLTVYVHDQGKGIEQEDLKHLFRLESVLNHQGTLGETGSGLGLMLCRELAEINKTKISATSEPGKGSIFSFTIPVS